MYCVLRIPVFGFWSNGHTVKVYSNGYWVLDVVEYDDYVVNTMHTEAGKYNMTLDFDFVVHEVRLERTYVPKDETSYLVLEVYRENELVWRESMVGDELVYKLIDAQTQVSAPLNDGPPIEWSQQIGRQWRDVSYSVIQTSDGGYLSIGSTNLIHPTRYNAYVVKTDSTGNLEWEKSIFGPFREEAMSGLETREGNFLIAGRIKNTKRGPHLYLTMLDREGNFIWSSIMPRDTADEFGSIIQTSDGYIISGYNIEEDMRDTDALIIKTDLEGELVWRKTYGSPYAEEMIASIAETSDGNYVLVGTEEIELYDPTPRAYGTPKAINVILFFVDSDGNVFWGKEIGGGGYYRGNSVALTRDGGFIVAGSYSLSGRRSGDALLVKTDETGEMVWSRTFGGPNDDTFNDVIQTHDGGYLVVGSTASFGAPNSENVYIVKTDEYGNQMWSKTYGGGNHEYGICVQQTSDGGYIISGSAMPEDRDFYDVLLLKLAPEEGFSHNWILNEPQTRPRTSP